MKTGDIVKVENFEFLDGNYDEDFERMCIILFKESINNENIYCLCPVVGQVDSYNRNPQNYYFLPITNKKMKKLYFAKLNSAVYLPEHKLGKITAILDNVTMIRLMQKMEQNVNSYGFTEYYEDVMNKIKNKL